VPTQPAQFLVKLFNLNTMDVGLPFFVAVCRQLYAIVTITST
jgi:hypothetical protein